MSLDLRDLRWAIVAAQHRSLRQAAEKLHVRQSTLSRRLRDLEHKLGATVFERTNGGTRPTIEGQEFLESARRIVEDTEAITTRFRTRTRGESGRLTIGVHSSLSAGNLRATLIEHRTRFPDVETILVDGSSDHLACDLASSAIDIAFMISGSRQWEDKKLPVWNERLVLAIPDHHLLSGRETVRWEDLGQESLLLPMRGPGPEFHKVLHSKFDCSGCRLFRHDVSLDRLLTLVGAGWGILVALEGATGATYSGVSFRELHDADGAVRLNFSAYWRDANNNPSLRSFLAMLRERYPDLSEVPTARK
jgi:DNA-binding transcriptional LysR family regulator